MKRIRYVVLTLAALLPVVAACTSDGADETPTPEPTDTAAGINLATLEVDGRPFRLYVPSSYDESEPAPLVIGLHGYTSHSAEMESYFRLVPQAEQRGFLYAMPDGTTDPNGNQFWNATNACCDMFSSGVDDSGYLSNLIERVKESYSVDADKVFFVGHSNGGYMSHRMACEHADQITAIASLAGVLWDDPSMCRPSRPVSVLQIHGTSDDSVNYRGGVFGPGRAFPGAEATVAQWRDLNGCSEEADTSTPRMDFDFEVSGAETVITVYADGCRAGSRVALWTMEGSDHVPTLTVDFTPAVLDFFFESAS